MHVVPILARENCILSPLFNEAVESLTNWKNSSLAYQWLSVFISLELLYILNLQHIWINLKVQTFICFVLSFRCDYNTSASSFWFLLDYCILCAEPVACFTNSSRLPLYVQVDQVMICTLWCCIKILQSFPVRVQATHPVIQVEHQRLPRLSILVSQAPLPHNPTPSVLAPLKMALIHQVGVSLSTLIVAHPDCSACLCAAWLAAWFNNITWCILCAQNVS